MPDLCNRLNDQVPQKADPAPLPSPLQRPSGAFFYTFSPKTKFGYWLQSSGEFQPLPLALTQGETQTLLWPLHHFAGIKRSSWALNKLRSAPDAPPHPALPCDRSSSPSSPGRKSTTVVARLSGVPLRECLPAVRDGYRRVNSWPPSRLLSLMAAGLPSRDLMSAGQRIIYY
jgi:hypothetical protein